jgi:hypothetical protein
MTVIETERESMTTSVTNTRNNLKRHLDDRCG